jgi:L-lactate dehydrogenase
LQVIDPEAFGGLDGFLRQTGWLARAVMANPPRPGSGAVRLPGAGGLASKARMLRDGVELYPGVLAALAPWAERFDVAVPAQASARSAAD